MPKYQDKWNELVDILIDADILQELLLSDTSPDITLDIHKRIHSIIEEITDLAQQAGVTIDEGEEDDEKE